MGGGEAVTSTFSREFLHVVQCDGELAGAGGEGLLALIEVEALALGDDSVLSLGREIRAEIAGGIGGDRDYASSSGGTKLHARALDAGAGFIDDAAGDVDLRLEAGAEGKDGTPHPRDVETNRHGRNSEIAYA